MYLFLYTLHNHYAGGSSKGNNDNQVNFVIWLPYTRNAIYSIFNWLAVIGWLGTWRRDAAVSIGVAQSHCHTTVRVCRGGGGRGVSAAVSSVAAGSFRAPPQGGATLTRSHSLALFGFLTLQNHVSKFNIWFTFPQNKIVKNIQLNYLVRVV